MTGFFSPNVKKKENSPPKKKPQLKKVIFAKTISAVVKIADAKFVTLVEGNYCFSYVNLFYPVHFFWLRPSWT